MTVRPEHLRALSPETPGSPLLAGGLCQRPPFVCRNSSVRSAPWPRRAGRSEAGVTALASVGPPSPSQNGSLYADCRGTTLTGAPRGAAPGKPLLPKKRKDDTNASLPGPFTPQGRINTKPRAEGGWASPGTGAPGVWSLGHRGGGWG